MLILAAATLLTSAVPAFTGSFAATQGWVKAPERPYRDEVCLNGKWQFQPIPVPNHPDGVPPALPAPRENGWSKLPLKVPSPWNVNRWTVQGRGDRPSSPYHTDSVYYPSYPREWDDARMGWVKRSFRVPTTWKGKRVRLHFEAVAGECQVLVNGKPVGKNFDSFLPFELDVTDVVKRNAENTLSVGIRDSRLWNHEGKPFEAFRAPYPPGSTLDHITGIWQDVYLLGVSELWVSDVYVQPKVGKGSLETEVTVQNDGDRVRTVEVNGDVRPWINRAGKDVASAPEEKWTLGQRVLQTGMRSVRVPAHGSVRVTVAAPGSGLKTWSPDAPNLYGLVVNVREGGKAIDAKYTRFGWREFKIRGQNLMLNGKKINLHGDLLHPFGPFIGSRRYIWAWYRMVKEMGGNAVRPHAQPHPRAYLDLADEMGICVLDETALFGSSIQLDFESPEAWNRFNDHYDRLVLRDRNHASVFGWSCGNELFAMFFKVPEPQRTEYYDRLKFYAQRSFRLDPTRQWVSCDGDEDLRGGVSVWSKHHGIGIPEIPDLPKPRMVGESGGSYYAKPAQLAELNGDRAYESYIGRNEALAIDLYRNIRDVAIAKDLAFFSASETGWFGVEHLALGYTDHTRPPNFRDGVWFGEYREGQPGVQPERLPPYCMTFNPGFDRTLPLYKPLPMFQAYKAALAGKPIEWKKPDPVLAVKPVAKYDSVAFLGDMDGSLARHLKAVGVPISSEPSLFLIVDTATVRPGDAFAWEECLAKGGTVFLANGEKTRRTLQLRLRKQNVTMLIPHAGLGLSLSDLYFAEDPHDPYVAKYVLQGSQIRNARPLLEASNTDWSLFNDLSEEEKCSNLLIYEQLIKPSNAVLVEAPTEKGRLLVSSLDFDTVSESRTRLWRHLFAGFGVVLGEPRTEWLLPSALAEGSKTVWNYTVSVPAADWTQPGFADDSWSRGPSGFGTDTPGSRTQTPWTTSDIWLRKIFEAKPEDLKELALSIYHDEDVEVFVNGKPVYAAKGHVQSYQTIPFSSEARGVFHEGINTIAVHCHQTAGGQYIDVGILKGLGVVPGREYDPLRDGPKGPLLSLP